MPLMLLGFTTPRWISWNCQVSCMARPLSHARCGIETHAEVRAAVASAIAKAIPLPILARSMVIRVLREVNAPLSCRLKGRGLNIRDWTESATGLGRNEGFRD